MAGRRLIRPAYSGRRSAAILLVGLLLGAALVWLALQPLRPVVADRYVARGDTYLQSQQFADARAQYRLALRFNPADTAAAANLILAERGETDPAVLRQFYRQHDDLAPLAKLDQALSAFADPKQALVAGAGLYVAHEYAYARYPLEKAVGMDPQYAEAWNYLALDYGELAKLDSGYLAKEKAAAARRDALTTSYLK